MFIYLRCSNDTDYIWFFRHKQKSGQRLHLDGLESAIQLLALVDLSDEEVSVTAVDFGVGDVDHVLVDVKIHLKEKVANFYTLSTNEWNSQALLLPIKHFHKL